MQPDDADAAPLTHKRFLRHHDQVAAARRFVAETLPRGSELRETARLLVSETVTSMLDQAPAGPGHGTFEVALAVVDHRLRVEVSDDGGPARLRHRIHDLRSPGWGGLQLLQTLARRWGVREDLAGRTIWFELDLPGSSPGGQPDRSGLTRSSTGRILRRWWRHWTIVGSRLMLYGASAARG